MPGLPDATVTIQDGGLGILPAGASGLHAKVGVASKGTANQIVSITDQGKIGELLGVGPLADALFDSFAAGARTIYAVRAQSDVAGTVGAVTATKTGAGNMTAAGSPLDAYAAVIEILTAGRFNTAAFRYSLDGGDTWSAKITVPAGGVYAIPDTGATLTFTESGVTPETSFLVGDKYTFSTVAPTASVANINAAIDALFASGNQYEFIHVVGVSDSAVWAALATRATEAEGKYRYIHFLAEARGPNAGETVDQWVTALVTAKGSFASTRVSISAGRVEISDGGTGRQVDRNVAGLYAGRVSAIPVMRSPGRVADGSIPGVIKLLPDGINDGHIKTLDDNGFITFRTYIGLAGIYVTNGRIAAPAISDYQYVELRRVMDKACTQVRTTALRFAQAEADAGGLDALEAQLSAPLEVMQGAGEIVSGRVVIPRDQDILGTSTLRAKIRIVPKPIMRWIELDIGFENPFVKA